MKSVVNYNFRNLNMNNIYKKTTGIIGMMCLLSLSVVFTSCSSDDDEPQNTEQNTDGRKLRQLTIAEVPITRATLDESGSAVTASWTAGDKATLLNVSAIPIEILYGEVAASSNAFTSTFTGSVSCDELDVVALIYPKVTPAVGVGTYSVVLSGQKGTLTDIATHFHYVYGVGQVTSVKATTATATIEEMKSLLAMCKFTFNDGTNPIPVKTLTINYEESGYPLTGTVTPSTDAGSVAVNPDWHEDWDEHQLTVTLDNEAYEVYVALFPERVNTTFRFTVTGSAGTYTSTAKAKLNAGKYYPVNLTLTK
jgi:hypothetical protein